MCKRSSFKTSTGTTQMEKPDRIYSPRKRGYLLPSSWLGALHERGWDGGVHCVLGAVVRLVMGNRVGAAVDRAQSANHSLFLHLENSGCCADWKARSRFSSGSVIGYPSGLAEVGYGALTSRDPAEWRRLLAISHLVGALAGQQPPTCL